MSVRTYMSSNRGADTPKTSGGKHLLYEKKNLTLIYISLTLVHIFQTQRGAARFACAHTSADTRGRKTTLDYATKVTLHARAHVKSRTHTRKKIRKSLRSVLMRRRGRGAMLNFIEAKLHFYVLPSRHEKCRTLIAEGPAQSTSYTKKEKKSTKLFILYDRVQLSDDRVQLPEDSGSHKA